MEAIELQIKKTPICFPLWWVVIVEIKLSCKFKKCSVFVKSKFKKQLMNIIFSVRDNKTKRWSILNVKLNKLYKNSTKQS